MPMEIDGRVDSAENNGEMVPARGIGRRKYGDLGSSAGNLDERGSIPVPNRMVAAMQRPRFGILGPRGDLARAERATECLPRGTVPFEYLPSTIDDPGCSRQVHADCLRVARSLRPNAVDRIPTVDEVIRRAHRIR